MVYSVLIIETNLDDPERTSALSKQHFFLVIKIVCTLYEVKKVFLGVYKIIEVFYNLIKLHLTIVTLVMPIRSCAPFAIAVTRSPHSCAGMLTAPRL